jgi:hypothetical protein
VRTFELEMKYPDLSQFKVTNIEGIFPFMPQIGDVISREEMFALVHNGNNVLLKAKAIVPKT